MGERYSEDKIRKRVCLIPLVEREEIILRIRNTIDLSRIEQPREWEMTSTLVFEGLILVWRAWKTSFEKPIIFLANGGSDERKTYWMSHVPDIAKVLCDPQLQEGYRSYLERYFDDPLTQKAFSAAVVLTCDKREEEKKNSLHF